MGLAARDQVRLSNETGEMTLQTVISDEVPRGAALSHNGRWPGRETQGCNVNRLNSGEKSDMGESSSVHGTLVEIHRVNARADPNE
jgi:anaerobic selenocysteine-containing dehydrogenase